MTPTLKKLLSTEPPAELFHYTSLPGIIGILDSRSIWASRISHLNDASELRHTLSIATKTIQDLDVADWIREELLNLVDCTREGPGDLFAVSLTSNGDQLSQWRGYTTPGSGYSVGFSTAFLKAASASWGLTLGPCCYDGDAQVQIVGEIVAEAVSARQGCEAPARISSNTVDEPFCDALRLAGTFLKHKGFSEEREWRLAVKGKSRANVRFRAGTSYVVPYLELKFDTVAEGGEPLRRIVIGPTPNPTLAQDALVILLAKNSFRAGCISNSSIPYRSW